jgi:ADP-heptose:LPS heptosyltransferase
MKIDFKKPLLFLLIPFFQLGNLFFSHRQKSVANIIFHSGKLGDLVCATALFKAIKEARPQEKLIVVVRQPFVDILENNPYLDKKITFQNEKDLENLPWLVKNWRQLNQFQINHYFNLMGNFLGSVLGLCFKAKKRINFSSCYDSRSQRFINIFYQTKKFAYDKQIKEYYFDLFQTLHITVQDHKNQLFFNAPTPVEVTDFFQRKNLAPQNLIIGISVTSGKEFKRWPDEYWVELSKKLDAELNAKIIFFGTPNELATIKKISAQLPFKTFILTGVPLAQLPYYLQKCHLFISVDTGPLYIADALQVPVVDIMGPFSEINQRPENNYRLVIKRRPNDKIILTPTPSAHYQPTEIINIFSQTKPADVFLVCRELLKK